jgi:hypothetical protein
VAFETCLCHYHSKSLHAPHFGIPFLAHNDIITDHVLHSCIDKRSGYNLINPNPVTPPLTKLSSIEKRKTKKKQRKIFIEELKSLCNKQLEYIENSFEVVKETCFIGAISNWIKTLAQEETLWKEEQKLCEEYKCLFEPIPHVDELSTDILAEITLKDLIRCSKPILIPVHVNIVMHGN